MKEFGVIQVKLKKLKVGLFQSKKLKHKIAPFQTFQVLPVKCTFILFFMKMNNKCLYN